MMSENVRRAMPWGATLAVALLTWSPGLQAQATGQPSTAKGDWPMYTADLSGTKYSPLDQIDASNFNDLEVAWTVKTDNFGPRPEYKLEGTPVAINGTLYATAGSRRDAIAINGATGEIKWVYSHDEGLRGAAAPRQLSGRGLSYWTDGHGDNRVVLVTTGYMLVELNAETGRPVQSFGDHGMVDLKKGVVKGTGQQIDLTTGEIGIHSTATVVGNTIIVGSAMREGMTVPTSNNTKGLARAYDARTGKLIWRYDTVPMKASDPYAKTWLNGSWAINGNNGVWTEITVDPDLGIVYLPIESPTSDYYGGKRPGDNVPAETLMAVDLKTGKEKWHFQYVHHPIWDMDMSSAPILADITVNGKKIKAVAEPSKQAWLYVFNRETGEPVWPIKEKKVPQGNVPGEWYAPTQPHPPQALMYGRNALNSTDDLIDFTPALHQKAVDMLKRYVWYPGVVFNPAIVGHIDGKLGAITLGNAGGGTNWPGGGYDPETQTVYVQANTGSIGGLSVAPPPKGFSDLAYQSGVVGACFRIARAAGAGQYSKSHKDEGGPQYNGNQQGCKPAPRFRVDGMSPLKPPYGILASINLDKGEINWRVPHGDTPDNIRNNPELKGMNIPKTGQPGSVGLVVTKTLVILGDPEVTTTKDHPRGAMLRAYNKQTGKQVGAVWMPAQQSGSPMTYLANGKQYVVVAISGGAYSGEYRAFTLPSN